MSEKYWFGGLPFKGLKVVPGDEKYWFGGTPIDVITLPLGALRELLGEVCCSFALEVDAFKSKELSGECACLLAVEGPAGVAWRLGGEAAFLVSSVGEAVKVTQLRGDAAATFTPGGQANVDWSLQGAAAALFQAETKIQLHLHPLSAPHLTADALPYLGAGVKLTYDVGVPYGASYWEVIGMDDQGWEIEPHGSLKWNIVRANADGLAVNYYYAPTDPAAVGQKDRILAIGRLE